MVGAARQWAKAHGGQISPRHSSKSSIMASARTAAGHRLVADGGGVENGIRLCGIALEHVYPSMYGRRAHTEQMNGM